MANSNLTPAELARMSIAEQYEWFKNATSRRSLIRGGLVGAGALAAGGVRDAWTAIFDQYSVDLVINGHNHVYERTDPLKAGAVTTAVPIGSTVYSATQGTTYAVAGGAGNSLYSFTASDSYEGDIDNDSSVTSWYRNSSGGETPETVDWSRVRYTGYSLLAVQSEPASHGHKAKLVLRALNEYNVEVDKLTIQRSA